MRLRLFTLAAALFPVVSQFGLIPESSAARRALVIGLGEQEDPAWKKINGDKDVAKVKDMLSANGFKEIVTLVNKNATKRAIVDQLQRLGRCSKAGDVVYIHFSGHGQRVTDLDGDEPDGWDEAWVPYDAYRTYSSSYKGENHLIDDELYNYLSKIRGRIGEGGLLAVVVDACHSGDSTRACIENEDTLSEAYRGVYDTFNIPGPKTTGASRKDEKWITLSACRAYQLNQEYKGMGKLTYILTSDWGNLSELSNDRLCQHLDRRMQQRGVAGRYPQNPEIKGDGSRFSRVFMAK